MEGLRAANEGYAMPYGGCPWTDRAEAMLRDLFAAPDAEIRLVPTGTSANALLLASLTEPWRRTFCSDIAHIHVDEMGALAFYSGGGELALIPQTHGQITGSGLQQVLKDIPSERHGPVSLTQVTEAGTVYPLAVLARIAEIAAASQRPVHLDGARFANAVAALGCTAAQMASGMTAVSFGCTKTGGMGVEAAVLLDPSAAPTLATRRHRSGHLFSKHRYLAAQIVAYLQDDLWLRLARDANAKTAALAAGLAQVPDVEILHPVDANIIFARWPNALHDKLAEAGAVYYRTAQPDGRDMARLVCDWSVSDEAISMFLDVLTSG